jgi:hypothetical protein
MSASVCLLLVALFAPIAVHSIDRVNLGGDLDLYLGATRRWLGGGAFYEAFQLAGRYPITDGAVLYPPVALLLFVPFVFLPAFLWWAVPAATVAGSLVRLRPHPMAWPLMTGLALFSPAIVTVWAGNPVMWVLAALSLGCVLVGPAALVLIKPSLFPFALVGANRRRWWIALALFALACLPFWALWVDWMSVLLNSDGSLGYSAREALVLAIPLVAWTSRRRGNGEEHLWSRLSGRLGRSPARSHDED